MEYYFQQPSTKYDWDDFQKKVFKRNQGKELQRKMIVKNIHSTSEFECIELKHVCLHMNTLLQSKIIREHDFKKLQEYFQNLKNYLYDYFIYKKIKAKYAESNLTFL